jgi:hypothetical protein
MPWPIPTLTTIKRPQPISLRIWLPVLVAVAASSAAAVLKLWPVGTSTHTVVFLVLLIGAPTVAVGLLFGWEHEQLTAEESEHEKQRIEFLWRDWCRRHLPVYYAEAFLPQTLNAAKLGDRDAKLPVSTSRSASFDWGKDKTTEQRRADLLGRIAARFKNKLTGLHEIALTLVLDKASFADETAWTVEAKWIFETAVKGVKFNVGATSATDCADWIERHIDVDESPARLIVAAQLWYGEGEQVFSEGAAAILFAPRTTASEAAPSPPVADYVLRPMTTGNETLKADLLKLIEMQVTPHRLSHVWFTGCDDDFEVAVTGSLNSPEAKVLDCRVDSFVGLPGPVSGWIALSLALEAGKSIPDPQLVVWRQTGGDQTRLCVVAPGEFEGN